MQRWERAGLVLLALVVKGLYGFWAGAHWMDAPWLGHAVVDVWTWEAFFRDAQAGQIPYVHFTREYPVGAGILHWAMAPFVEAGHGTHTAWVYAAVMGAIDLLNVVLLHAILRRIAPARAGWLTALYILLPTNVLLSPLRFEAAAVLMALAGYWFHLHDRPYAAAACWAVGAQVKWFPALFVLAQEVSAFVGGRRWQWVGSLGILAGVSAAFNLPFVLLGHAEVGNHLNWSRSYLFHLQRPLYWDTVLGVWALWWGTPRFEQQASHFTLGLVALALLAGPRLPLERRLVLVCLAALVLNRIYSPQFHLWFYPFLILAAAREETGRMRLLVGCLVALDLLNMTVYPFTFTVCLRELGSFASLAAVERGGPGTLAFSASIVARALLLVVLAALLLRPPRDTIDPS